MWSLLRKGASPEWWAVICEACWGTALSLVLLGSSDKGIIDEEVWVGRRKDFFGNLVWGCHKFQKHPVGKHIKHVLSEAGCHISSLTGYFGLLSSSSCAHCSEIRNVKAGHLNLEAKGVKAVSDFVGLSVAVRVWAVLQFLFSISCFMRTEKMWKW